MYVAYPAVIHVHAKRNAFKLRLNQVDTAECSSRWFKVLSTIIINRLFKLPVICMNMFP